MVEESTCHKWVKQISVISSWWRLPWFGMKRSLCLPSRFVTYYCPTPFRSKKRGYSIWFSLVRDGVWSRNLVNATPPSVLNQSFWNFTGVLIVVWRYACAFFFFFFYRSLFFFGFFFFFLLFFHNFNLDIFAWFRVCRGTLWAQLLVLYWSFWKLKGI